MPELARFYGIVVNFYGIVVKVYYADHAPPHFHVEYGEYEAQMALNGTQPFAGRLPSRAAAMVREWAAIHADELLACWERAQAGEVPGKIAPLD